MSAQTGVPSFRPPPTSRGLTRLRDEVRAWESTPNPVWLREMRQAARLTRTPFILMTVTALTALLLCSIGGILVGLASTTPATTGVVLYQVFFSVAFFVVTLAGPAVAANSIASEREGRTWEALQLTGLAPGVIARGKFLAAYTSVALYIVMMAPVGALPFLFGGVTATEVAIAFLWLFLLAGLSVAFGLAVSSKMESLRAAILWTLLAAFMLAPTAYGVLFSLSFAAKDAWPNVDSLPVWLPSAYERAPFDMAYVAYLVALPIAIVALPAWFLYEATIANLTSITDDRSTGLKHWFLVTSAIFVVAACALPMGAPGPQRATGVALGITLFFLHVVFSAFVFAGEPIGPSRRVLLAWDAARAGPFRRMLGPGVVRATTVVVVVAICGFAAITSAGLLSLAVASRPHAEVGSVLVVGGYGAAFAVFVAGFTAWVRARTNSPGSARLGLVVMLFVASAGPWIVAAIAGLLADTDGEVVAAPSPIFALRLASKMRTWSSSTYAEVVAAVASAAAWSLLGLGTFGRAAVRCRAIIRDHEAALAASDAILAAEDAGEPLEEQRDVEVPANDGDAPTNDGDAPPPAPASAPPKTGPEET